MKPTGADAPPKRRLAWAATVVSTSVAVLLLVTGYAAAQGAEWGIFAIGSAVVFAGYCAITAVTARFIARAEHLSRGAYFAVIWICWTFGMVPPILAEKRLYDEYTSGLQYRERHRH